VILGLRFHQCFNNNREVVLVDMNSFIHNSPWIPQETEDILAPQGVLSQEGILLGGGKVHQSVLDEHRQGECRLLARELGGTGDLSQGPRGGREEAVGHRLHHLAEALLQDGGAQMRVVRGHGS